MKNKESHKRINSTKSLKSKFSAPSRAINKYTNDRHFPKDRSTSKENLIYKKSQIDRLKKFYNTTRWLPNSAFTTYLGKPAFENYGYGNTNPVYGGLFYGNYMLSHNINPIDGVNSPETKQVYSSAMLKAVKRGDIRSPEPPRKTPEEIRNTEEELEEINTRNPIFQLPNNYPGREIVKPDLLKSRYFRSGKNTPIKLTNEVNNDEEWEVFNINDVLNNKKLKKKKIDSNIIDTGFNPFEQGKVKIQKKKIKDNLDYKWKNNINESSDEEVKGERYQDNDRESNEYLVQKQFYEKMLDEAYKNQKVDLERDIRQQISAKSSDVEKKLLKQEKDKENVCFICENKFKKELNQNIKKKENPCLLPPGEIKHANLCCAHGYDEKFRIEEMNPKYYKDKSNCALNRIIPAGKPIKKSVSVAELFK